MEHTHIAGSKELLGIREITVERVNISIADKGMHIQFKCDDFWQRLHPNESRTKGTDETILITVKRLKRKSGRLLPTISGQSNVALLCGSIYRSRVGYRRREVLSKLTVKLSRALYSCVGLAASTTAAAIAAAGCG